MKLDSDANSLSLVTSTPTGESKSRIMAELNSFQAKVDTPKRLQAVTPAELDALLPALLDHAFNGEL